jgi:class 3 adenylate cyclase
LVLHRRDDRFLPVGNGRYLADHIQGARLVPLNGADCSLVLGDSADALDEIQEFLTGVRPVPEPDRVLATVLFTDIVGSTDLAARLGDKRWHALLEQHHRLVREQLSRFRGREIDTAGDGFFATLDGPARAIRCATTIRDRLRDLGLTVRAGLHTGEVELMGDKVGGIAVHTGARVSAQAGPGEVLVSRTVVDLVAGSGIIFEDRGEHRLKGVPGLWRLFAVTTYPSAGTRPGSWHPPCGTGLRTLHTGCTSSASYAHASPVHSSSGDPGHLLLDSLTHSLQLEQETHALDLPSGERPAAKHHAGGARVHRGPGPLLPRYPARRARPTG